MSLRSVAVVLLAAGLLVGCDEQPTKKEASLRQVARGRLVAALDGSGIVSIGVGEVFSCALRHDGKVLCWGDNTLGMLSGKRREPKDGSLVPVEVPGLAKVTMLDVGPVHSCARLAGGAVRCWGSNVVGALDGQKTTSFNAGIRRPQVHADEVVCGSGASCALEWGRPPQCWGENRSGRLGAPFDTDPLASPAQQPRYIEGLPPPAQIAIGGRHGCAIAGDGAVWCWGLNNFGQLGRDGERGKPAPVATLRDVVQITSAHFHNCVLDTKGRVWCWGRADNFQLGLPSTEGLPTRGLDDIPFRAEPQRIDGLDDIIEVDTGGAHSCALRADGTVWCWGTNGTGQLGNGTRTDSPKPVQVSGLEGVVQIAVSPAIKEAHACALKKDHSVWCWGHNEDGRLGDGTTETRETPVQVKL